MKACHAQGTVLSGFHQFAFPGAFIIDSTEMKDSVDDDAMQLASIGHAESLSIAANGV